MRNLKYFIWTVALFTIAFVLASLIFMRAAGNTKEIISFEPLDESIAQQTVPEGTEQSALNLPVVLTATVFEQDESSLTIPFGAIAVFAAEYTETGEGGESGEDLENSTEPENNEGVEAVEEPETEDTEEIEKSEKEETEATEATEEFEEDDNSVTDETAEEQEELSEEEELLEEGEELPEEEIDEENPEEEDEEEEEEEEILFLMPEQTGGEYKIVDIAVTWESEPVYDGASGIYIFTPQIPDDYSVSSEAVLPQIEVLVVEMLRAASDIFRVTSREQLMRVFSHGDPFEGDVEWSGHRTVEIAFNDFRGVIHTNDVSEAPGSTTRTVTLVSDGQQRNLTTVEREAHLQIGNKTTVIIDDENLHFVGNPNNFLFWQGGLRVDYGGNLILNRGSIRNINTLWHENPVSIRFGGTFTMNGGIIENNRSNMGGGVALSGIDAVFNMYGGIIQNNYASVYGGGVDVDSMARFNMYDGVIRNNIADGEGGGGGVRVDTGSLFNMFGGIIEGNKVTSSGVFPFGGGVSVADMNSTFNMNGGIIKGNTAPRGGGVSVWEGIFNLGTGKTTVGRAPDNQGGEVNNPQIIENTATGGGITWLLPNEGMPGGGGVYVYGSNLNRENTNFIMHNGLISRNKSLYRGGGVFLTTANFKFKGGEISYNETTDNTNSNSSGGGIYLHDDYQDWYPASLIMEGGVLRGNVSRNGGGIGRHNQKLLISIKGNALIADNTAEQLGGGIYAGATAAAFEAINLWNIERGRDNLITASTVRFEGNKSLMESFGLTVGEVKQSTKIFNNLQWQNKNSAYGIRNNDQDFHILNNHDISNLQGKIIKEIVKEGTPVEYKLAIGKTVNTVAASGHDFANREMYFDFTITLIKSNLNTNSGVKYKAYVLDEKNTVVTSSANFAGNIMTDPVHGAYIEFTEGKQESFSLKHGQWLSFVNLETGVSYRVTELVSENYTTTYTQTIDGSRETVISPVGENTQVPEAKITRGNDRVDFVNSYVFVVPVGVRADVLPYVVLAGLALMILTGQMVRRGIVKG